MDEGDVKNIVIKNLTKQLKCHAITSAMQMKAINLKLDVASG